MENRAVSLDSALCEQHGIAVYRVGDVYDTDDEDIPESDRGKWFVSAIVSKMIAVKGIEAVGEALRRPHIHSSFAELLNLDSMLSGELFRFLALAALRIGLFRSRRFEYPSERFFELL